MPLGNMDNMTDDQTKALSTGFTNWQAQHNPQPTTTPVAAQGVTPQPQADPALVAQHQAAADAFKAAHWYNGGTTATPSTQSQNLAAVAPTVANPTTNVAYQPTPQSTQKLIGPILTPESQRPMVPVGQPASTVSPTHGLPAPTTGPFTSMFPNYAPPAPTTPVPTVAAQAPQQDGTLHLSVNGQAEPDVPVFKGTSFESGSDLAKQLGLDYKADPKTGEVTIGGTKVMPTGYDKQGNAIVGVRAVANALGYQIGYDDKSKQITITGNAPTADIGAAQAWTPPDLSGSTNGFMPYSTFNGDMNSYYTQAHNQLDAQYNQQKQALIDKQNLDISKSDESMNRRGIYSSGVAQSVEDDLRTKTTAAIANVLASQMANVAKTAQSLYDTAYKQYLDGNAFALKNNQSIISNMLATEKQSFNEYIQTHKLTDAETNAANAEFDKQAALIQKDNQSKLPYEYQTANNIADNQTKQAIALLPYQQMTVYQQMTTQEKAAMDQATNYFKQQGIAVDYAKLAESITHNRNTEAETSAHNVATETQAKDALAETSAHNQATEAAAANKAANTIDPKDSFSQAASFKSQLNAKLANDSKNIDHAKAAAFIDANKGVLTDSDYRDLQAWVDTTFKK